MTLNVRFLTLEQCSLQTPWHNDTTSTVLNVLFTRALHTHLPPSSLSPNTPPKMPLIPTAVNPGYCVSLLRRSFPLSARINARVREILYGRTAEEGARQLIWGALGPDGKLEGRYTREWMSGVYVSTQQAREPSDFVIGKEGWVAMERAWVSFSSFVACLWLR